MAHGAERFRREVLSILQRKSLLQVHTSLEATVQKKIGMMRQD